jgi:hypothetical protein
MDTPLPIALTDHDLEQAHGGAFAVNNGGLDKNPGGFQPNVLKSAEQFGKLINIIARNMF